MALAWIVRVLRALWDTILTFLIAIAVIFAVAALWTGGRIYRRSW